MKQNAQKKLIIILIVAALLAAPFVPAIVCDIRTWIHGDEFESIRYQRERGVSDMNFRVLRYDADTAELYYWASGKSGITVSLEKTGAFWTDVDSNVIWQRYGSAHEVVPQYWFHFFYFINQRRVP